MIKNNQKALFSERLHHLCDEKGLPIHGRQSAIRDEFVKKGHKMSQESVRKWLSAEAVPKHDNKVFLCDLFNVKYEWLSTGKGDKRTEELVTKREMEIKELNELLRQLKDVDFNKVKSVSEDLTHYLLEKESGLDKD